MESVCVNVNIIFWEYCPEFIFDRNRAHRNNDVRSQIDSTAQLFFFLMM
jgi:hypothetical protein